MEKGFEVINNDDERIKIDVDALLSRIDIVQY